MITPPPGECQHRKGIVEFQNRHTKEWDQCMKHSSTRTPVVFGCEHEALQALEQVIGNMALAALLGQMDLNDIPLPREVRYTYVDQEPEGLDVEVTDTRHADHFIQSIKEKL